jgi:hypothetical protein
MLDPREWQVIDFSALAQPRLVVLVDAEEEFDWREPFSRSNSRVSNIAAQHRAHRIFDLYRIVPTYMVDYPVARQRDGYRPLAELHRDGRAAVGAQLHPWVTPPFTEEVTVRNSFAGNLPRALERAKLSQLVEVIEANFGLKPTCFTAGRYGVGRSTQGLLEELGFGIDSSVRPHTEYLSQGGPDFRHCGARPYWVGTAAGGGRERGLPLLELPRTVGLAGLLAANGRRLFDLLQGGIGRRLRLPGLFARGRLLERIALTPEGMSHRELRRLTGAMLATGHRVFVMSYHSPSLVPGNTPYVNSGRDLTAFLDRLDRYFDYFLGTLGGVPATPDDIRALALAAPPGSRQPATQAPPLGQTAAPLI